MPTIDLNILQERELARLLDYERATCTVDGDLVYHCAFPYRPDDDLQVELIAHGALMQKTTTAAAPWSPSRRTATPTFPCSNRRKRSASAASVAKRASWAPPLCSPPSA